MCYCISNSVGGHIIDKLVTGTIKQYGGKVHFKKHRSV